MEIDHFIEWDLAKENLLEVHAAVLEAIRVCDVALHSDSPYASDQLLGKLTQILKLDDGQIEELSVYYLNQLATIRRLSSNLGEGEINNEPSQEAR